MSELDDRLELVQRLQKALDSAPTVYAPAGLLLLLVEKGGWAHCTDARGVPFYDFGAFAVHVRPQGLEVRDRDTANIIKHVLCSNEYFGEWVDFLERIVRRRGAPSKNPTIGGFKRFYSIPDSPTARDRALLKLKAERTDLYKRVLNRELSPFQASLEAGFVRPNPRRLTVEELHASIKVIPPEFLIVLIREAWERLSRPDSELLRQDLLARTAY